VSARRERNTKVSCQRLALIDGVCLARVTQTLRLLGIAAIDIFLLQKGERAYPHVQVISAAVNNQGEEEALIGVSLNMVRSLRIKEVTFEEPGG